MSFLNPVKSKNGCQIVSTLTPDGNQAGQALFIAPGKGFGYQGIGESAKYAVKVSDSIDYEISCWILQQTVEPSFEIGVKTFNSDFIETDTYDIHALNPERYFLKSNVPAMCLENKFHFARFILYGKAQNPVFSGQPLTSLGVGTNLVMSEKTALLFINLKCTHATKPIVIWNFKIKPLKTPFSTGILQSVNMLQIWRKNNNKTLNNEQVDEKARHYLLPYNTGVSVINL